MKRYLINFVYWLCVLVLLFSVAMGMRSCSVHDKWNGYYVYRGANQNVGSTWQLAADSASGELMLYVDVADFMSPKAVRHPGFRSQHLSEKTSFKSSKLEFRAGLLTWLPPVTQVVVHRVFGGYAYFPYWVLVFPGAAVIIWRHFKKPTSRFPTGHCMQCGYDLRGTPDRCPECGNVT